MKKVLFAVSLLMGVAFATPSFAEVRSHAAPQAANFHNNFYSCAHLGFGWQLISQPTQVLVQQTTYQQRPNYVRQCVAFGPFGGCRAWQNVLVGYTQVPVVTWVPQWVQSNYCIYTGVGGPF